MLIMSVLDSECQIMDWDDGMPRPHKQMCGRPLDEGVLKLAVESPDTGTAEEQFEKGCDKLNFPPPIPSFRRSPALLWQINELKEHGGHYAVRLIVLWRMVVCTYAWTDSSVVLRK